MLNRISAGILAVFVLLTAGLCAQADERILKFVSDIDVASNGTLTVTETITVSAEGDQIKRGIFRDIPLAVEGANGRIYKAGFKLLSVLQDGAPASYHTNENSQGVRIYVGTRTPSCHRATTPTPSPMKPIGKSVSLKTMTRSIGTRPATNGSSPLMRPSRGSSCRKG